MAGYTASSLLQLWAAANTNLVNLHALAPVLRLGPGHRKLEIDFAALSFTSPENVQFRYRLSRFDADGVEAGHNRSALYPHLPAGRIVYLVGTTCHCR